MEPGHGQTEAGRQLGVLTALDPQFVAGPGRPRYGPTVTSA